MDSLNLFLDDFQYQKGEVRSLYDLSDPSVSNVVEQLFKKNIESNTFNQEQSKNFKHKSHNLQQMHSTILNN